MNILFGMTDSVGKSWLNPVADPKYIQSDL